MPSSVPVARPLRVATFMLMVFGPALYSVSSTAAALPTTDARMPVALPLETKALQVARAVSDEISPRPPTRNQTMLNKAEPGVSVETKDQEPWTEHSPRKAFHSVFNPLGTSSTSQSASGSVPAYTTLTYGVFIYSGRSYTSGSTSTQLYYNGYATSGSTTMTAYLLTASQYSTLKSTCTQHNIPTSSYNTSAFYIDSTCASTLSSTSSMYTQKTTSTMTFSGTSYYTYTTTKTFTSSGTGFYWLLIPSAGAYISDLMYYYSSTGLYYYDRIPGWIAAAGIGYSGFVLGSTSASSSSITSTFSGGSSYVRAYCLSYTDYSSLVASNSLVQRSGYSKQYTVPVSALSSYSSSWQQHYTGSTTYCTGSGMYWLLLNSNSATYTFSSVYAVFTSSSTPSPTPSPSPDNDGTSFTITEDEEWSQALVVPFFIYAVTIFASLLGGFIRRLLGFRDGKACFTSWRQRRRVELQPDEPSTVVAVTATGDSNAPAMPAAV